MGDEEINVNIRSYKETDFGAVLDLAGGLITAEELSTLNPGKTGCLCFVAEVNELVAGFGFAHELRIGIPTTKICILQGIVVRDEYRRHGIGEKLTEAVANYCIDNNIEAVRILVDETDTRLKHVVERLGFRHSTVVNFDKTF